MDLENGMKRIAIFLLIICLLLPLGGCGRKNREEVRVLRIGVLEPTSGKLGAEGLREMLGIQYANATTPTIQLNGKTYQVELVLRDNESDPLVSAQAASELVEAGCAVVLGSYGAELSAAASDVFRAAGVAAIAADCDDPSVTAGNDHYFRIGALPEFQGGILAAFARKTLSAKTAYCLSEIGSESDAALIRSFQETAAAQGMKIVTAGFPTNCVDFTPYLSAAAEEGASVFFAPCEIRYAQRILEQAAELESAPLFLADDRWRDEAIKTALKDTSLTVYVTAAYAEGASSEFDKGFREWLESNSEAFASNGASDAVSVESALGCDAYSTALAAAKQAGSADKADILAILPRISRTGVTGFCAFDADGGAVRKSLWIERIKGGAEDWELVGEGKIG